VTDRKRSDGALWIAIALGLIALGASILVLAGCAATGAVSDAGRARTVAQPGATLRMTDGVWSSTAPGQAQIPAATFSSDSMRTDQAGLSIDTITVALDGVGLGNTKSAIAIGRIEITDGERRTVIENLSSDADTQNAMLTAMIDAVRAAQERLSADEIERLKSLRGLVDSVGGVFGEVVGAALDALTPVPSLPAPPAPEPEP